MTCRDLTMPLMVVTLSSPPLHGTLTIKEVGDDIDADMPPIPICVCDLHSVSLQCFLNLFLHALHELR